MSSELEQLFTVVHTCSRHWQRATCHNCERCSWLFTVVHGSFTVPVRIHVIGAVGGIALTTVNVVRSCAQLLTVAYWRSLLIGPHYRSDKRWHDTQVIRARHFFAMLRSRLMSIVMIVCVEHEHACVRARASCDGVPYTMF